MRSLYLIITILVLLGSGASRSMAQGNIEDEYQMKQYFMVLLKTGPHRDQDSASAAGIMKGHLNNIARLMSEKKMVLAGPFMDEGTFKGIFIFDVASREEVIQLLSGDPAIKAGRLDYEIHPWYGPGHIVIEKKGL